MKNRKGRSLILKVMRITLTQMLLSMLFACTLLAKSGAGQAVLEKTVTVKAEKIELGQLLQVIKEQTGASFIFGSKAIKAGRKLSVNSSNKKLSAFLDEYLAPMGIGYRLVDDQIVLFASGEKSDSLGTIGVDEIRTMLDERQKISGVVTDSAGGALAGASIVLKSNPKAGTTTDVNGRFSLTVDALPVTLQISYTGYEVRELTINSASEPIAVKLSASGASTINDVIVVGYGTQRKRDLTGSITRIGEQAIKSSPVNSPDQALQGRVAGVQVMQTSGAPGGAVQVRVRGVNTTASGGANQPLYVVDGVPLVFAEGINSLGIGNEGQSGGAISNGASPLNTISPNDIESIEVLKDASATAIYGARAANGVVIITTKSGKMGKPQVTFDASYGVQSLRKKVPVTNARERAAIVFDHRRNRATGGNEGFDIFAVNPFLFPEGTDWQDEMFRTAPIANYNLGISGGTDKITYSIAGDYLDHQGIVLNTYSRRAGLRVNLDVKASNRIKFGTRTNISNQWENSAQTDDFFQSDLNSLFSLSPIQPVYDATGNFAGRPNSLIINVLWGDRNPVANQMERIRRAERTRTISNVYGEFVILPELKFKSSLGVDYLVTQLRAVDPYWVRGVDINSPLRVFESSPKTFNWIAEQTLSYSKRFGEHSVNAVAGFSAQEILYKTFNAAANGSVSNALNQLVNNPTLSSISGTQWEQGLVSQFIRANYSYQGKYLFTGTIRRDGSSRFGANNKYGIFPSASAGWRISEEDFLKDNRVISDLKLRASYGSTGNQEIGEFLYAALMGNTTAVFGNSYLGGLAPSRFENNDIRWERNNQFDVGIDLSLYSGRINLTMDYYNKRTKGLLAPAPMSVISGVGNSYTTNIGEISNSGLEFALNADIVRNKDFTWNIDFNIASNKNEVISLGDQPFINGATVWRVNNFINRTQPGHPIGAFYLIETNGMYLNWADASRAPNYRITSQPFFTVGDFIPVDQNKDGVIDDLDRVWAGSPFPRFFGGITNTLKYRNWAFTVFAPFQQGNKVWNQPFLNASTFEGNVLREIYDNRYLPSNPGVATYAPVPRQNHPIMPIPYYFLQDGSFLRIRTISLAYEVPVNKIKFVKLSRLRFYAQANNFFVFTKYKGWDPEVSSFGSNVTTNGIDAGAYPQAKSLVFGLNVGF